MAQNGNNQELLRWACGCNSVVLKVPWRSSSGRDILVKNVHEHNQLGISWKLLIVHDLTHYWKSEPVAICGYPPQLWSKQKVLVPLQLISSCYSWEPVPVTISGFQIEPAVVLFRHSANGQFVLSKLRSPSLIYKHFLPEGFKTSEFCCLLRVPSLFSRVAKRLRLGRLPHTTLISGRWHTWNMIRLSLENRPGTLLRVPLGLYDHHPDMLYRCPGNTLDAGNN